MNFSLYIAKRYLFTPSKTSAINIITSIASLGIIVGAMALFIVLSVFSGLRQFSLSFTNDFDPDYKVLPKIGKSFLVFQNQINTLQKIKGYNGYSLVVEERVLFYFNNKEQVTTIKGIDSNFTKHNKIASKLYNGQWLKPNSYQAVVGYGIAQKLGLGLFDFNNPLEVYAAKPGKGLITDNIQENFNKDNLLPVGIYAINEEIDTKYVFTDLGLVQQLLNYKPNQISAIEVDFDKSNEQETIAKISRIFNNRVTVKTRAQLNATLYKMLNTENFVLYLIFTLVIIMILFAFAGSIIMIIIDKKENLKTLVSIGTDPKSVKKIFLYYGTMLCSFGGIVGILLGSIIVFIQKKLAIIMITDTLPYPVEFEFENFIIVLFTIVLLGFLASFIASSRVSKGLA